jgi:hypothetical protein
MVARRCRAVPGRRRRSPRAVGGVQVVPAATGRRSDDGCRFPGALSGRRPPREQQHQRLHVVSVHRVVEVNVQWGGEHGQRRQVSHSRHAAQSAQSLCHCQAQSVATRAEPAAGPGQQRPGSRAGRDAAPAPSRCYRSRRGRSPGQHRRGLRPEELAPVGVGLPQRRRWDPAAVQDPADSRRQRDMSAPPEPKDTHRPGWAARHGPLSGSRRCWSRRAG